MRTWAKAATLAVAMGLAGCGKLASVAHLAPRAPPRVVALGDAHTGSAVVLASVGGHDLAYVADEDDAVIHVVDTEGPTEIAAVPLPGRPGQLLVLADGHLLAAIRGGAEVVSLRILPGNIATLEIDGSIPTAREPIGLATTPDGKRLLVASGWGHALSVVDLGTGRETLRFSLPRDPRAVVTSADGKKAFVSHAVGSSLSVVDLDDPGHSIVESSVDGWSTEANFGFGRSSRSVRFFNSDTLNGDVGGLSSVTETTHARMACQGFALARIDGPEERVLAPQVLVETGDVTSRSGGYGSGGDMAAEMPNVAVVPVAMGIALPASMQVERELRTFGEVFDVGPTREDADGVAMNRNRDTRPCILPRAATTGRGQLYVACLGIDSVIEYEAGVVAPERVEHRRWRVPAGPVGLAQVESKLYVWSEFARSLTVIDLDAESTKDGQDPPLVAATLSRKAGSASAGDVELGRMLFHASSDPRIANDGRACASCHPDGRDDSLTWSTPGGPRQTPMLAGRIEGTAPYGWDGAGEDVKMHLDHTFQRLRGNGLQPYERAALIAYLKTLPVPPREGDKGALADRGAAIFHSDEAKCGTCHAGDATLTDGLTHDVESKLQADAKGDFDTPSLRFVAGTAPYFHDGRYATLRDVLAHTDGTMGATSHLSDEEKDALEAYVETL